MQLPQTRGAALKYPNIFVDWRGCAKEEIGNHPRDNDNSCQCLPGAVQCWTGRNHLLDSKGICYPWKFQYSHSPELVQLLCPIRGFCALSCWVWGVPALSAAPGHSCWEFQHPIQDKPPCTSFCPGGFLILGETLDWVKLLRFPGWKSAAGWSKPGDGAGRTRGQRWFPDYWFIDYWFTWVSNLSPVPALPWQGTWL